MQYFTHYCHNPFTLHVSNLIRVEFLLCIKSRLKKSEGGGAQNVLHLNLCTHGQPCKVPGAVANGLTGIKYALEKRLFIFNSS